MRKKLLVNVITCLLVTITFCMIYYSKAVMESVSFSISIWIDNLFPSLFPFFIVSNLLLEYGFVDKISRWFNRIMPSVFHLPKEACFPFIISMFSGFPSGAKYTSELVKLGYITQDEGARLLTFTHYSNPLFILGFIATIIFNNFKIGIVILVAHVFTNILVGIIFRKRKKCDLNRKIINISHKKSTTFGSALRTSIFSSLDTMCLLLGIVTIFLILTTILNEIFNFNPLFKVMISGLFEMTQGIKGLAILNIPIVFKVMMATFFISFGGLSVHIQVLSIIDETKIKYKYFFLARIVHSILAAILVSILYMIFI